MIAYHDLTRVIKSQATIQPFCLGVGDIDV